MDRTPNLGLSLPTFKDRADIREIASDNRVIDTTYQALNTGKVDNAHLDDAEAHKELLDNKVNVSHLTSENPHSDAYYTKSESDKQISDELNERGLLDTSKVENNPTGLQNTGFYKLSEPTLNKDSFSEQFFGEPNPLGELYLHQSWDINTHWQLAASSLSVGYRTKATRPGGSDVPEWSEWQKLASQSKPITFEPSFLTSNRDFTGEYLSRSGTYVVLGGFVFYEIRIIASNTNGTGRLQLSLPLPTNFGYSIFKPYVYIQTPNENLSGLDKSAFYLGTIEADDRGIYTYVYARGSSNGQASLFDMSDASPNGVMDITGLLIYRVGA